MWNANYKIVEEENTELNLDDLGLEDHFLDSTVKAQPIEGKNW